MRDVDFLADSRNLSYEELSEKYDRLKYAYFQSKLSNMLINKVDDSDIINEIFRTYGSQGNLSYGIYIVGHFSKHSLDIMGDECTAEHLFQRAAADTLTCARPLILFRVGNTYVMIIERPEDCQDSVLEQELSIGIQLLRDSLPDQVKGAVSAFHENLDHLIPQYLEALAILDHSAIRSELVCCELPPIVRPDNMSSESLFSLERQFSTYMLQHSFQSACLVFDGIMDILISETMMPLLLAQETSHMKLTQSLRALQRSPTICGEQEFLKYVDMLDGIFDSLTFGQLHDNIHLFFDALDRAYCQNPYKSTAEQIRDYISNHFYECTLSTTQVCDVFHISPSHLSKIFKNEIGCTFVNYVHSIRVTEAKKLLMQTDHTIAYISELVGFTNRKTMVRAFHSIVGMTPQEFRRHG